MAKKGAGGGFIQTTKLAPSMRRAPTHRAYPCPCNSQQYLTVLVCLDTVGLPSFHRRNRTRQIPRGLVRIHRDLTVQMDCELAELAQLHVSHAHGCKASPSAHALWAAISEHLLIIRH